MRLCCQGLCKKYEGVNVVELKMYVFGEQDSCITWVAAEDKEQAVGIFQYVTSIDIAKEIENPQEYIREAHPGESMTYYHDGSTREEDTMENLIKKYCDKPDIFATSEF